MHKILEENIAVLNKPYKDLLFLLQCFSEVLEENNHREYCKYIPWLNTEVQLPENGLENKFIHLYSICFQLLNQCEVNWAVQSRRKNQEVNGAENITGTWANTFKELKLSGISKNEIVQTLSEIKVEPVLTAHPTEAKRTVVLKNYRELYLLVVKLENSTYTTNERKAIRNEIKQILTRLWFIDDIYLEKPKVEHELDNMLYYLTTVFPDVFNLHHSQFVLAWQNAGFDTKLLNDYRNLPRINFGTWVGGDRDGHPLVTPEITKLTLEKLRKEGVELVRKNLNLLADSLSIYTNNTDLPTYFLTKIEKLDEELLLSHFSLFSKNELFKDYVNSLILKLPINSSQNTSFYYKKSSQLIADLEILQEALSEWGAPELAMNEVARTIRFVSNFGFHLAHLDIRQNSVYNEKAFFGLLNNSLGEIFSGNFQEKSNFIKEELKSNRPFFKKYSGNCTETINVLAYLGVIEQHVSNFGTRAIGSVIVSMTKCAEDLFIMYLLCREAGLWTDFENKSACILPVVPLFETIEDLQVAPDILGEFLKNPLTINSLKRIQQQKKYKTLVLEVMIGYSDSNKDGGILAGQWNLFEAQYKLTKIAEKHSVEIRFFHGKGGSISRGAGPVHWFLRALPPNSFTGKLRLTEQGETIERKYANKVNAAFNIELLVAGSVHSCLLNKKTPENEFFDLMKLLSSESYKAYIDLTQHADFIRFYEQATPIDAIESSKIGSRPSRRTNQRILADLRAIPWVFSWSQARMNITSWYGVGITLKTIKEKHPEKFTYLKKIIKENSFIRYLFTNIDSGLATTDISVLHLYAGIVTDENIRQVILSKIITEFELANSFMLELLGNSYKERRSNHYYSTRLRAVALDAMHHLQVRTLIRWREIKDAENTEKSRLNILLLKSINAIASALGVTG